MQSNIVTQYPMTDEAILEATGKTWETWFAELDTRGGPGQGRRAVGDYLFGECKLDPWWSATLVVAYEDARGVVEKDGRSKGYMICVTKTITAPLDRVYAAWASADELNHWFSSSNQAEVVDGGRYQSADGDTGTYKRVRPNKDLRMTWENPAYTPGTQVDVAFADKGKGKTGITITHDRIQTRAEADGLRAGWAAAMDALKQYLEAGDGKG
jgi:uncharacterized protein YndB with AHSA1/START domain